MTPGQAEELQRAFAEIRRVSGLDYATEGTVHLLPGWYRDLVQARSEKALAEAAGGAR